MGYTKKKLQQSVEYPLYNVCYMKNNGEEVVILKEVGLKKSIEVMKKFDNLLTCNGKLVEDILYFFILPLRDKKPHLDPETLEWCY